MDAGGSGASGPGLEKGLDEKAAEFQRGLWLCILVPGKGVLASWQLSWTCDTEALESRIQQQDCREMRNDNLFIAGMHVVRVGFV